MKSYNFIKKRLQHRCFPLNIAKFLRTPTLKNICERLLLFLQNTISSNLYFFTPTKLIMKYFLVSFIKNVTENLLCHLINFWVKFPMLNARN